MESIQELYRIGPGPSSSHTIAPWRAATLFKEKYNEAVSFSVELYGSLSLTGKGHMTDQIIINTFKPKPCTIQFRLNWEYKYDNGLIFRAYDARATEIAKWTVFSLGGGSIKILEEPTVMAHTVYPYASMEEIILEVKRLHFTLPQLVWTYEPHLHEHLSDVLTTMFSAVKRGLESSGVMPGKLEVEKIAKSLYLQARSQDDEHEEKRLKLIAYAYANSEENASGHMVVTAPTLGASGVMASLMYHLYYDLGITRHKLIEALEVAGLFGNVIKKNATISGAVGGCQAEIGSACSMAAAAYAYVLGLSVDVIAYAAEIAMEHHLGLTCDPVGGYVIIPCIERNAAAVLRAMDAVLMAKTISKAKPNRISFDQVVHTMNYTGQKIVRELKETSLGGLAQEVDVIEE